MRFRQGIILWITILLAASYQLKSQSYNHWVRSFNEESSLLAGAVVGGGAGPSAIYYNPAIISEINESQLSVHASLFSYKIYNVKNALGDGIDVKWSTLQAEPRFLSYMIKPKNHSDMSFEIAMLNNENYKFDVTESVDDENDILFQFPGPDRYFAFVQTQNRFRDDWIGGGWSWKLNERLSVGASMFVCIKSLEYLYNVNIEAYPLDTVGTQLTEYTSANFQQSEYLKYNDYRLLWKAGIMYKWERLSIGVNFTSPSLGGIYSDGKRVYRMERQSGVSNPETGLPMPDYFVGDYQEKKAVKVNNKTVWSIAAGLTYHSVDRKRSFYTTIEYFGGLDIYKLIEADESPNLATSNLENTVPLNEWLTFISGADPVFNAAVGYSWIINEDLWLMTGFRTDFNYIKNIDFNGYDAGKAFKTVGVNNYHLSGGLSWKLLGKELMTGVQYTFGYDKNLEQIINLSDPVEYNSVENKALQGTRQSNMRAMYNSISLYIGATFNFGSKKN